MAHLKQCLGVDLGAHTVKIAELAVDKSNVTVVRAAQGATGVSPGMTDDEKRASIAAAARDVLKKNKFGTKKAVVAISGLKVFVRRFRLPTTSEERLNRMIQFEARQQIPFPVDKTILQYSYRQIPGEEDMEILLSAVRSDDIRDFMLIAQKAGLSPIAVGVSSFALYNSHRIMELTAEEAKETFPALATKKKPAKSKKKKKGEEEAPAKEQGPQEADADAQTLVLNQGDLSGGEEEEMGFDFEEVKALINIGATSFDIAIGRMGKENASVLFVRTVAMGGDAMTKAIMKSLEVESFFDAEKIKVSSAQLMAFNFDFEENAEINQDASMAVSETADRMVTEIRRSLDFFITQPDGMAIDSVSISGGQSMIPRTPDYLEEKLTVPVALADAVPETCILKWNDQFGSPAPYLVSMGLALQGVGLSQIEVDFLPEERKIIRDFPYKIAAVMLVIIIAMTGLATQAGSNYASKYASRAESLESEKLKLQRDLQVFNTAQSDHDAIAEKFISLEKTFGQRDFWMDKLVRLAEIKPPQIVLEDVRFDHDGSVRIFGVSEVTVAAADFQGLLQETFADEFVENPDIVDVVPLGRPIEGLGQDPARFEIAFKFKTKQNHLDITPTPTPSPTGGSQQNFGNFGAGGNRDAGGRFF